MKEKRAKKTIRVRTDTLQQLKCGKALFGMATYDQVIAYLAERLI